jgi:hypothetical protein
VFFDDILVYSPSLLDHFEHLKLTLEVLRSNQLFAKKSKCRFGCTEIDYLGHLISAEGVQADGKKLSAMIDWPVPRNLKALRGFLGLTGYYRKFIKGYGSIAAPLTDLLKKNAFSWSELAAQAFVALKEAVTSPPVLVLPDFTKPFVIECDASGRGIGAVLMQNHRPIAFFSQVLKGRFLLMSTYEKELLALVAAVKKWRPYVLGHPLTIKTDHQSLKFLLEQKIGTPMQQRWVSKLLGYDFVVEYKKGQDNKVADALSRRNEEDDSIATLFVISYPTLEWLNELKGTYVSDPVMQELVKKVQEGLLHNPKFVLWNGILLYKKRVYVGESLRNQVLSFVHASPIAGHAGFDKTIQRARKDFVWPGMKSDVKKFIKECDVCQRVKAENLSPAGLLQPLPIPDRPWSSISMDFIEGLPLSHGYSVVWVVVDRLTKYGHFIPLKHPFTAEKLAQIFMTELFKLHGMPLDIVSDRDSTFTSRFWTEIFKLQGVFLAFSTAYHPQSDGQTEAVNKYLENYLRCMVGDKPKEWVDWLPLAQYCYNTAFHHSTKVAPFEAVFGYSPPRLLSYMPGTAMLDSVEDKLKSRDQILQLLKENLYRSQNRMKLYADLRRTERHFQEGDWVYLRLQPYRQLSVTWRRNLKLSPRFYGPFQVVRKVGTVAYELQLPADSSIHPVFHVSQLKLKLGRSVSPVSQLPPVTPQGIVQAEPEKVLNRRTRKVHNQAMVELLVQWQGQDQNEATWESFAKLKSSYPHLVGKVF